MEEEIEMVTGVLDFERIMALSYKACKFIQYRYGVDLAFAEEKALDVWVEKRSKIEELASYTDSSKTKSEKTIYFIFKDNIRTALGIYQCKNAEGKNMWYSPHLQELTEGYDTIADELDSLEILDIYIQKDIYYEHQKDFNLTAAEILFIDLVFSGYNPTNEIDVLVFKEALDTASNGYVKTFLNRLCKKLKSQSEEIGLR